MDILEETTTTVLTKWLMKLNEDVDAVNELSKKGVIIPVEVIDDLAEQADYLREMAKIVMIKSF